MDVDLTVCVDVQKGSEHAKPEKVKLAETRNITYKLWPMGGGW